MADIGTVTVHLSPTIDTGALAASIRSAVADALEQVAGELRAEASAPRWTVGQTLTEAELDDLPPGAVVRDRDGDKSTRLGTDEERIYGEDERATWRRRLGVRSYGANFPARVIANFPPVTLVSLP